MSADDHLQPQQFMSVEDVGRLRAGNLAKSTDPWAKEAGSVDEWAAGLRTPPRNDEDRQEDDRQGRLDRSVAKNGVRKPLAVFDGVLWNGHHRYAAAKAAGLTQVPVREALR